MIVQNCVPVLPESAPFTPEQRAYLNGFFAGLFSRTPVPNADHGTIAPPQELKPLTILFGSQTGNSENLAKRAAKESGKFGFAPTVTDLSQYKASRLPSEERVLLITSTYGDGEPPDNARGFWDWLHTNDVPRLDKLEYSVLALGDSNYPGFCACGQGFDHRFEVLGARRVHPRADCETDYDEPFHAWLKGVLPALRRDGNGTASGEEESVAPTVETMSPFGAAETGHSRANPFPARLVTNRRLTPEISMRDRRHLEISLEGSGLSYEAGDALGVMPSNCPELVEILIGALGATGEEDVPGIQGVSTVSLRQALMHEREIVRIGRPLLELVAVRTGDAELKALISPEANGNFTKFLFGRDVLDLLCAHPQVRMEPAELVGLLKRLQPRSYSISSTPKAHSGHVHLTVAVVRYKKLGRLRMGVCSAFLADRVQSETAVPVYVQTNKAFRLPVDGSKPIIMIGPGTGIAPFRAFLQERSLTGASGKNWLFFGDQSQATDFLYRDEIETFVKKGLLTRFDTAFSRDQEEKIYVQHRMKENARELFSWLEEGASFYVCGDASRMAKDVDQALHEVVCTGGGLTGEQAAEYVNLMRAERRYVRDVY